MKVSVFFFYLITTFLLSCQSTVAQPAPVISKKYSNTEIERMINAHKSVKHIDVCPTLKLQQQFSKDFPNAKDIDWETGANIYEVEFEIGRTDYKAYYDGEANLIKYTIDIEAVDFPAVVKNASMSKYPNFEFDDIKKIMMGTATYYKIEMENGKSKEIKVLFKPDGAFIKEIFN